MEKPKAKWMLLCAASALSLTFIAGCDKEDAANLAFSHHLHVIENEMSCSDCHGKASNGHFQPVRHEACASCHGEWIETPKIGKDTCGVCHKIENIKEGIISRSEPNTDHGSKLFVHTDALAGHCKACHVFVLDKNIRYAPKLTRNDKIRICDQSHRARKDCGTCHVNITPDTPPSNHQGNWTRRHGVEGQRKDNVCGVCHEEASCRECHKTTTPTSHNNFWRLKAHGAQAAWDRQRCAVCHEQDSCKDCHEQVRPQSHNAAWGETHCTQCHVSSSNEKTGCAFCHEEDQLADHPDPHSAGWRSSHCNNCHEGSPEIAECEACHGTDLLAGHSNPHSGGWRKNHCAKCHSGATESGKCDLCHDTGDIASHESPHSAGWRDSHCDKCHSGAPESGQCGQCHGVSDEASHPNPHSAGWLDSHCNSCHPGPNPRDDCGACHPGGNNVQQAHQSVWESEQESEHDRFAGQIACEVCHEL